LATKSEFSNGFLIKIDFSPSVFTSPPKILQGGFMKKIFIGLSLFFLPFAPALAESGRYANRSETLSNSASLIRRQNLMGEVSAIDPNAGRLVVLTDAKTTVNVTVNDKTAFRRVQPGQTSLTGAEQIKITDIKVGDRILIPGGVADEKKPVRQVIVMPRAAIDERRALEDENRRARTTVGRIAAVNPAKNEITIQTRGSGGVEVVTVSAAAPPAGRSVKFLRYAPDSLKVGDAVASSFNDLRVGDQVRVLGDRVTGSNRINAEEILSGSVSRVVGSVSEINTERGEIVVKNEQTGQLTTVALGKNTTLRRITPEAAETLRQRFERRRDRQQNEGSGNARQNAEARRNRAESRNQDGGGSSEQRQQQRREDRNARPLFENLPVVTAADLKKGDAVMITGTSANQSDNAARMTAVTVISGEGRLLQLLQRAQGGGRGPTSPGLPGSVSGGNALIDDDDPRRQ
jgi:hypothetical protein